MPDNAIFIDGLPLKWRFEVGSSHTNLLLASNSYTVHVWRIEAGKHICNGIITGMMGVL